MMANLGIAILLVASIRAVSIQTNAKAERRTKSERGPLVTQRELSVFVAVKDQNRATSANGTFTKVVTNSLLSAVRLHEDISNDTFCNASWTHPTGNGSCECGDLLNGAIRCNISSHTLSILNCYCMTHSESTGITVAGVCVYNCDYITSDIYTTLPLSLSSLYGKMCGHFHRTGQLCGQCEDGFKQPAYFYGYQCVNCTPSWLKYIAVAFFPLTLFLVIVLCCRISVTSPRLNAFVFCSQVISAPQVLRSTSYVGKGWSKSVIQTGATIYGIWNLDFFRTVFPEICLDLSSLQVLALDYAIAFYPLLLMIVFYILIELHDSNYRPVVYLWRPFNRCLSRFRRQWNAKNSTVDAFATFLLLSYTKILSVSANLLLPTLVYNVYGQEIGLYLYYDATVNYFGKEHLPYAVIALTVFFIFVLAPVLLLILYPMRCFQRCLGHFRVRWHALHIFADSFQGCYKDGTNGTRDCRYFAAMYLIVRIIMITLFEAMKHSMIIFWECLALLLFCISIAIIRPYKPKYSTYNTIDTILIFQLAIMLTSMLGFLITKFNTETNFFARKFTLLGLLYIIGMLPLVYFFFTVFRWLCSHIFSKMFPRRRALQHSLPDRIVNPDRYDEELLHNPTR